LLARCEQVELRLADVLYKPGEPVRHVFFPTDSFISLITPIEGPPSGEWSAAIREGSTTAGCRAVAKELHLRVDLRICCKCNSFCRAPPRTRL